MGHLSVWRPGGATGSNRFSAKVREVGGDGCWWTLDLADLESVAPFADRVWAEMGPIDVLVNNAGAPRRRSMKRLTPEELDETVAVNFTGSARLSLALLPYMLERDSGAIVNVSSMGTQSMAFRTGAYGAAKAALNLFTEGLYFDLVGTGVRAHLFTPGSTDTEFLHPQAGKRRPLPAATRRVHGPGRCGQGTDRQAGQ